VARFDSVALLKNREFAALAGTAFARSQAYSTILIALALYADLFNTSGTVEGLWGTMFALVQLVIVLPLGRYVDVGNSKRYLLVGLALNVLVFVGYGFVSSVEHVILMRMLQGFSASMLWLTGSAVVGEISPDGSRGLWLGTYNQVGAFSSFAGDLVGGHVPVVGALVIRGCLLTGCRRLISKDHVQKTEGCEPVWIPALGDGVPSVGQSGLIRRW
jgi:MFS family permease